MCKGQVRKIYVTDNIYRLYIYLYNIYKYLQIFMYIYIIIFTLGIASLAGQYSNLGLKQILVQNRQVKQSWWREAPRQRVHKKSSGPKKKNKKQATVLRWTNSEPIPRYQAHWRFQRLFIFSPTWGNDPI